MEEEERDRERERVEERTNGKRRGKRKGDEERIHRRNRGRESVRRRGSSYYKWQSLPGAYDKGFSILQGIEIPPPPPPPPANPSVAITMGRSACHQLGDYPSPLKDRFTDSNSYCRV